MTAVRNSVNRIGEFLNVMGAAISASAAVRAHRAPDERDLRVLGISTDPAAMKAFANV